MQAKQTLPDAAKDTIRSEFDRAESSDPIVLWWDDGNYLEDIVKQACNELGIHLKVAEKTPLNSVPTPSAANRSGTSHTSRSPTTPRATTTGSATSSTRAARWR